MFTQNMQVLIQTVRSGLIVNKYLCPLLSPSSQRHGYEIRNKKNIHLLKSRICSSHQSILRLVLVLSSLEAVVL